jgi:CRP-like cAMP-binding protein
VQDVDSTTIEFEDEESALSASEFMIEHDPESILGRCSPFSQLPPVLVQKIESELQPVEFQRGEFLMRQGDEGDGLFVLHDGHVEIRSNDTSGESQILARCSREEILGEMALITDEPRTADVVATSSVRASFLPQTVFDQLSSDFPVISQVLTRMLADRLGKSGRDALAGKTISDYFIQTRLGRGGMAIVYKAEHTQTREAVALKMMSHRLVYDANALELFQRESRIIEGFNHPNIVRTIGRFRAFRSFFIVMEFCPGVSLDQIVRNQGLVEEADFRRIFAQVAAGLNYAHERGVIHRDIKPSNIMLTPDGQVKLMDFGRAKPVTSESARSNNLVAGTPRFMAPEQFQGKRVDARADLFSLGLTAWKLLTGDNLISARSLSAIDRLHASWQAPDVSDFPPDIAEFLTLCLQKHPSDRTVDLGKIAQWQ